MNCFVSSGDSGAARDAFGASARGRGAERVNGARSAENLRPTESRRRGKTTHTHTHARTSEHMHPKLYNLLPIIRNYKVSSAFPSQGAPLSNV